MPFPFSHICDLLQQVADLPLAKRAQPDVVCRLIREWFVRHRSAIDALAHSSSVTSAAALLSTLLPDLRTDRVYGIQARSLQRIIVRALGLGHSRIAELSRWTRPPDSGVVVDLADCVEGILRQTPNSLDGLFVSIEEVDAALDGIAAHCRFSSPAIRQAGKVNVAKSAATSPISQPIADAESSKSLLMRDHALGHFYRRVSARDAKWLTRLILKDFRPVVLDQTTIFRAFHLDLPLSLRVHSDFVAAVQSLNQSDAGGKTKTEGKRAVQSRIDTCSESLSAAQPKPPRALSYCPRLGVKVSRQPWAKARSIQHCLALGKGRHMSCERKMDGEYVQVHVDLEKGLHGCLQLFSKSGKDSTRDRIRLHSCIRASLRIGENDCRLKMGCILEGEMLAYSDKESCILGFDSVRKHVTRSGSMIYCNFQTNDKDGEHLMIVYYDLLFIDGESMLRTCHAERFRRLQELVVCRPGYAELVQREVIDFGSRAAAEKLRQAFARCISAHDEGLVLKADGDTYFDFSPPGSAPLEWPHMRCYAIKLKKGYVGQFGEVGDFAIIGARYDAVKAKEYPPDLPGLRWTHFYLGCLKIGRPSSRSMLKSEPARPRFIVTNVITLSTPQMRTFLTHCRPRVVPVIQKSGDDTPGVPFDLAALEPGLDGGQGGPTDLFAEPPIVEIRCFAFHRQGFGRFWSPRFPSVTKFHFDRTYLDTVTFDDLQTVARDESLRTSEAGVDEQSQDDDHIGWQETIRDVDEDGEDRMHWATQLKHADRGGIAVDSDTSQSSAAATLSVTTETGMSQATDLSASQVANCLPESPSLRLISKEGEEEEEESSQHSVATNSTTLTAAFTRAAAGERNGSEQPSLPSSSPRPSSAHSSASPVLPHFSLPAAQPDSSPSQRAIASQDNRSSQTSDTSGSSVGRSSRKHLCAWDVADLFPIVSPPQLKRPRMTERNKAIETRGKALPISKYESC